MAAAEGVIISKAAVRTANDYGLCRDENDEGCKSNRYYS